MFNVPQLVNNVFKFRGFEYKRISPGQEHIGNLAMLFYVLYRCRQVLQVFVLWIDKDALTETVPADPVTDIADQQKHGGRILVL